MTRGDITVHNARPEHLEIALDKLVTAGASVDGMDDGFRVVMDKRPLAVDAVTQEYLKRKMPLAWAVYSSGNRFQHRSQNPQIS